MNWRKRYHKPRIVGEKFSCVISDESSSYLETVERMWRHVETTGLVISTPSNVRFTNRGWEFGEAHIVSWEYT